MKNIDNLFGILKNEQRINFVTYAVNEASKYTDYFCSDTFVHFRVVVPRLHILIHYIMID